MVHEPPGIVFVVLAVLGVAEEESAGWTGAVGLRRKSFRVLPLFPKRLCRLTVQTSLRFFIFPLLMLLSSLVILFILATRCLVIILYFTLLFSPAPELFKKK
jgi:hypothetical protein